MIAGETVTVFFSTLAELDVTVAEHTEVVLVETAGEERKEAFWMIPTAADVWIRVLGVFVEGTTLSSVSSSRKKEIKFQRSDPFRRHLLLGAE